MGISLLFLLWFLSVTVSMFIKIFVDFDTLHRTDVVSGFLVDFYLSGLNQQDTMASLNG